MPPTPEGGKPSGHDEAAVLMPKPPRKLCKLLIDRQLLPPPRKIEAGTQELYVPEMFINLQIKKIFPENPKNSRGIAVPLASLRAPTHNPTV